MIFSGEPAGTDGAVLVVMVPPAQIRGPSCLTLRITCFYNPMSGELTSFTLKKTEWKNLSQRIVLAQELMNMYDKLININAFLNGTVQL